MGIRDWSSDVYSSDLQEDNARRRDPFDQEDPSEQSDTQSADTHPDGISRSNRKGFQRHGQKHETRYRNTYPDQARPKSCEPVRMPERDRHTEFEQPRHDQKKQRHLALLYFHRTNQIIPQTPPTLPT